MKICVVGGTGNISSSIVNLLLKQNHEIVDIQVIDSNKVLITISNEYGNQGIIFDIDKQKILYKILLQVCDYFMFISLYSKKDILQN